MIDISSNSGKEFLVEPGNIPQIEERFRINPATHSAMTIFTGAVTVMLFLSNSVIISQDDTINTAGTGIEEELMELIEGNHIPSPDSRTSFIDGENEEASESSVGSATVTMSTTLQISYGHPTAAILPTPRRNDSQLNETKFVDHRPLTLQSTLTLQSNEKKYKMTGIPLYIRC